MLCAELPHSDKKVANRNVRYFGWETAHAAVSRRPPIPLDTIVARTEGYTYAAKRVGVVHRARTHFRALPSSHQLHRTVSLMPTINGNTFAASLRTDICPQRKEARDVSRSDIPRVTIRFVAGHLADGERRGLEHGLLLGA
jgi:hypothetical protein